LLDGLMQDPADQESYTRLDRLIADLYGLTASERIEIGMEN